MAYTEAPMSESRDFADSAPDVLCLREMPFLGKRSTFTVTPVEVIAARLGSHSAGGETHEHTR